MKYFTPQFYIRNRSELLKRSQSDLIVTPAHKIMQRNLDNVYKFRQESNFWYLTGINEPDAVLVISKPESFLILRNKNQVEIDFDGAQNIQEMQKTSGLDRIYTQREGWDLLDKLINKHKKVGVLMPMQKRVFEIGFNPSRRDLINKIKRRSGQVKFEDIRMPLAQMRMIKQHEEIAVLKHAAKITNDSLNDVFAPKWWEKYKYEYELEAEFLHGIRSKGASGHAFESIFASGQNSCTVHYVANNSEIKKGSVLLVDVGAELENYAGDISRTIPIGEEFNSRQQEVYDAVQEAINYAEKLIKPGQNYMEYEKSLEEFMGRQLVNLGIIKRPTHSQIRKYFNHRTSHSLGIDPHDPADYSGDIQKNMVMTIEPGIYLPEEGFGVRVENDYLVDDSGCRKL